MTQRLADAILRNFLRYEIPPSPRDLVTRLRRYHRELRDLEERRVLKQGMAGALRPNEYQALADKLWAELEGDAIQIVKDPRSYRFWQPTADDWKRLALLQMVKDDPELQPTSGERISTKGDRLWYRAIYAEKALAQLADKQGIRPDEVDQKAAAALTLQLIESANRRGVWPFDSIPSKNTISSHWLDMDLARPLTEIHQNGHRLPSSMQRYQALKDHFTAVWQAADQIGFATFVLPVFSEFAAWYFERVPPESQLPGDVESWADFHKHATEDRSEEEKDFFRRLLAEFCAADVSVPQQKIAEFAARMTPITKA